MVARKVGTLALLLATVIGTAAAQSGEGFGVGKISMGPTLGLGGIGGASFDVGGRFEKGVKNMAEVGMGNGILGIQGIVDWYTYDGRFGGAPGYSFNYLMLGGVANYHFVLDDKQWDPFAGIGVGYQMASASPGCGGCVSSELRIIAHAGVQYYYSPKLSFYADAGAATAAINLGVMFRMQ